MQKERFPAPLRASDVDAFRVETQTVPPQENARVLQVARTVQDKLLKSYSQYIHPKSIQNNEDLPERLIVNNDIASISFALDGPFQKRDVTVSKVVGGLADTNLGIIYVEDVSTLKAIAGRCEGMFDAESLEAYAINNQAGIIAHEMVHQYQDRMLPLLFQEMSAYSMQSVFEAEGSEIQITSAIQTMLANGYDDLVEQYGDDVHALNFGTLKSYQRKGEILRGVSQSFSSYSEYKFLLSFLK